MCAVRVVTFNIENLLQRFDFYRYGGVTTERALRILGVTEDRDDYLDLRRSLFVAQTDDTRQMTAQAIRDTEADFRSTWSQTCPQLSAGRISKLETEPSINSTISWRHLA